MCALHCYTCTRNIRKIAQFITRASSQKRNNIKFKNILFTYLNFAKRHIVSFVIIFNVWITPPCTYTWNICVYKHFILYNYVCMFSCGVASYINNNHRSLLRRDKIYLTQTLTSYTARTYDRYTSHHYGPFFQEGKLSNAMALQ